MSIDEGMLDRDKWIKTDEAAKIINRSTRTTLRWAARYRWRDREFEGTRYFLKSDVLEQINIARLTCQLDQARELLTARELMIEQLIHRAHDAERKLELMEQVYRTPWYRRILYRCMRFFGLYPLT